MAQALKTSNYATNIVNRDFRLRGPRKVLLTDITYLSYMNEGKCYLSTSLDEFTRKILAYELSNSLEVDFAIATVNQLVQEYGISLDNEAILHSDQGCHYTSYVFIGKLKDAGFFSPCLAGKLLWPHER